MVKFSGFYLIIDDDEGATLFKGSFNCFPMEIDAPNVPDACKPAREIVIKEIGDLVKAHLGVTLKPGDIGLYEPGDRELPL